MISDLVLNAGSRISLAAHMTGISLIELSGRPAIAGLFLPADEVQEIESARLLGRDPLDPPNLLCAEHVRQLEGESPFDNLMEVKS
jgi:hypothetical protein